MAFCEKCGQKINDNAKFCPRCGSKAGTNTSHDIHKRKVIYDGEVKKCPNCGEILNSFISNCPTCGFELRNISVSNSIKELSEKIQQIESTRPNGIKKQKNTSEVDKQINNLIASFPIPNTKEDILEFMILASSNVSVSDAWLPKVEQAYSKAKTILGNNDDFFQIQMLYQDCTERIIKKQKEERKKRNRIKRRNIILTIFVFAGLPLLFLSCAKIDSVFFAPQRIEEIDNRLNAIAEEAETALINQDYKAALRIAESIQYDGLYKEPKRKWTVQREALIDKIIDEARKNGIELERTTETPTNK